jgi:hypothetical protein
MAIWLCSSYISMSVGQQGKQKEKEMARACQNKFKHNKEKSLEEGEIKAESVRYTIIAIVCVREHGTCGEERSDRKSHGKGMCSV